MKKLKSTWQRITESTNLSTYVQNATVLIKSNAALVFFALFSALLAVFVWHIVAHVIVFKTSDSKGDLVSLIKILSTAFAGVLSIFAVYEDFKDDRTRQITTFGKFYACMLAFVYVLSGMMEYESNLNNAQYFETRFGRMTSGLENTARSFETGIENLDNTTANVNQSVNETREALNKQLQESKTALNTIEHITDGIRDVSDTTARSMRSANDLLLSLDGSLKKSADDISRNTNITTKMANDMQQLLYPKFPLEIDFSVVYKLNDTLFNVGEKKHLNYPLGSLIDFGTRRNYYSFWDEKQVKGATFSNDFFKFFYDDDFCISFEPIAEQRNMMKQGEVDLKTLKEFKKTTHAPSPDSVAVDFTYQPSDSILLVNYHLTYKNLQRFFAEEFKVNCRTLEDLFKSYLLVFRMLKPERVKYSLLSPISEKEHKQKKVKLNGPAYRKWLDEQRQYHEVTLEQIGLAKYLRWKYLKNDVVLVNSMNINELPCTKSKGVCKLPGNVKKPQRSPGYFLHFPDYEYDYNEVDFSTDYTHYVFYQTAFDLSNYKF